MASIMTNASAMTALKSLAGTNKELGTTQNRISTGLRVAEASDNAAYWSIATTMRSDNKALSTVQDALGLGAAKLDVTYTGLNKALELVDEIKSKLVAASEEGIDKGKIQSEIAALQDNLLSNAESSSFNGENWLSVDSSIAGYTNEKSVVSSFTRGADGSASVSKMDFDIDDIKLFDPNDPGILDNEITTTGGGGGVTVSVHTLDITAAGLDETDMEDLTTLVDDTHNALATAASDLGAAKKRVDMQSDFVSTLSDAIERGVGQLVDADMNEESTRLQALQVQQQLGIQALGIANGNAQNILALFQG